MDEAQLIGQNRKTAVNIGYICDTLPRRPINLHTDIYTPPKNVWCGWPVYE